MVGYGVVVAGESVFVLCHVDDFGPFRRVGTGGTCPKSVIVGAIEGDVGGVVVPAVCVVASVEAELHLADFFADIYLDIVPADAGISSTAFKGFVPNGVIDGFGVAIDEVGETPCFRVAGELVGRSDHG